MLRDAHFMSIADRSILSCWGVRGGRAGRPFSVTIDPGGPDEREVDALADARAGRAGEVIRIRTTGGGGWGDPLDRPYDEVLRDVRWGKVSFEGARADYGVVVTGSADEPAVDAPASDALRTQRACPRTGDEPFFDRGPGYARLTGGATAADVDWPDIDHAGWTGALHRRANRSTVLVRLPNGRRSAGSDVDRPPV